MEVKEEEKDVDTEKRFVNCFRCRKQIERKFVPRSLSYSQVYNWDYWTQSENNKGKFICGFCLKDLRVNHRKYFLSMVKDKKKRILMSAYMSTNIIEVKVN